MKEGKYYEVGRSKEKKKRRKQKTKERALIIRKEKEIFFSRANEVKQRDAIAEQNISETSLTA